MASYSPSLSPAITMIVAVLLLPISCRRTTACYTSVFSFGDSIADTGNFVISVGGKQCHIANPPYGETFFHRPTGRYCDGRIILDFVAEALGKPFLPPFLGGGSGFGSAGVNFAVGGATALDNGFFSERGMEVTWTNYSLGAQMEWFKQWLPSLCDSYPDCNDVLNKSLFLVGEIGGNDYNHPFFQGRTLDEIRTFVPNIIQTISSAIEELIELGARTLLVPGNFPIGCVPVYLTIFHGSPREEYDPHTGCINWLNEFAEYHNSKLLEELDQIRLRHPYATIIYADYYNATLSIFRSPNHFGFSSAPLAACCGGDGPYNVNSSAMCGTETARVCSDPSRYISWDGIHFTEAAYKIITAGLMSGSFTVPPINHICPDLERGMNQADHIL